MKLERLLLINYRNYDYQRIAFHPQLNILIGENAQGKTNLLESVFFSARGCAFKHVTDRDVIRFGERSAYVRAEVDREGQEKIVEFKLSMVDPKRVRINEVELESIRELAYQFEVVVFSPEDLRIVQDGPSDRRRFMDELIRGIDGRYDTLLRRYQKILLQRNNLLKQTSDSWFDEQLAVYNRQLAEAAVKISAYRARLVEELSRYAGEYHAQLTDGNEALSIAYETNIRCLDEVMSNASDGALVEGIIARLNASLARDLQYRNTDIGVHKDDLDIQIDGISVRRYGSQGQSRTAILALKLAELKLLKVHNRTAPILLLDDVFSELDPFRSKYLLESIRDYQTIITTNTIKGMDLSGVSGEVFRISAGRLSDEGAI